MIVTRSSGFKLCSCLFAIIGFIILIAGVSVFAFVKTSRMRVFSYIFLGFGGLIIFLCILFCIYEYIKFRKLAINDQTNVVMTQVSGQFFSIKIFKYILLFYCLIFFKGITITGHTNAVHGETVQSQNVFTSTTSNQDFLPYPSSRQEQQPSAPPIYTYSQPLSLV